MMTGGTHMSVSNFFPFMTRGTHSPPSPSFLLSPHPGPVPIQNGGAPGGRGAGPLGDRAGAPDPERRSRRSRRGRWRPSSALAELRATGPGRRSPSDECWSSKRGRWRLSSEPTELRASNGSLQSKVGELFHPLCALSSMLKIWEVFTEQRARVAGRRSERATADASWPACAVVRRSRAQAADSSERDPIRLGLGRFARGEGETVQRKK
jgi:hypothetical protein